ncbi:helix-turn-helix domain-containing protein [Bacillus sp. FJAT-47783]|uniref:helix-turn-helix domain-containing protein n=1 Tax=Bacillus sp. FJAT-47783 TaxID=2922712 RepID=UPI001FAD2C39|nr:helix-turn-helix domain-containing protein [Bacillus sp. FJAT-47783]
MYLKMAKQYQPFQSVEALNEACRKHMKQNRYELSETAQQVFKLLSRYAVKVPGVAFLKINEMARQLNKHRSTIIRSLNRLEKLNMIKRIHHFRPVNGGNGANFYVILPHATPDMQPRQDSPNIDECCHKQEKNRTESSYHLNQNLLLLNNNTYSPYNTIKKFVFYYEQNHQLANRIYGVYVAHTKRLQEHYDQQQLLHIGIEAINITFQATKRKKIRHIVGYYNGVLDRLLDKLFLTEMGDSLYGIEQDSDELFDDLYELFKQKNS